MRTNNKFYDQDFAAWTQATAALVRAGQWDDPDSTQFSGWEGQAHTDTLPR